MSKYISDKLRVFKQLHIDLSDDQIEHMTQLKSEIAIDNYCRTVIRNS